MSQIPIKIPLKINSFIEKADLMITKNKELQLIKSNFLSLLLNRYDNIDINNKIENWVVISFKELYKELAKLRINLSVNDQADLMQYFEGEKCKANAIQKIINDTDKEIDQMVYNLYNLTPEEISIVENS